MSRDPQLTTFIQNEITASDFSDSERLFLSLLLVDNNQPDRSFFLYRLVSFVRGKDSYLPAAKDYAWGELLAAQELAGLPTLPLKLCRAVELLWSGCSLKPIEDIPALWRYDAEDKIFIHKRNRNYTKKTLNGPVMAMTEIHNFPNEHYSFYQGYSVPVSLVGQEYFLDPYKAPVNYYYTRHWNGRSDLKTYLAKGPREIPDGVTPETWLKTQREQKGIVERDHNAIFTGRVA